MPPTFSSNLEETLDEEIVENDIHDHGAIRNQHYPPDEFLEIPPSNEGLPPGIDWRKEGLFHGQESYSSFGEKGTTASVNAYGSMLQISRYLGLGVSGIFCANACKSSPTPLQGHMVELLDLSKNLEGGFGLCLNPQWISSKPPRLQFLHGRWPRYTHNIRNLSVSIQYFANCGAVIQQFSFQRTQEHEAVNDTKYNDACTPQGADDDVSQSLHEGNSVENEAEATQAHENQAQNDRSQNQPSSENCAPESQTEHSLPQSDESLGKLQKKVSIKDYLRLKSQLEISDSGAAYVVHFEDYLNLFLENRDRIRDIIIGQNRRSLVVRHQPPSTDEVVGLVISVFVGDRAMTIVERQNEDGKKTYDIVLDSENVDKFEQGQKSRLEITVAYELRVLTKDSSLDPPLIPVSVLDFDNSMARNLYKGLCFSESVHFDFIIKRNLEHILSVCSIPIPTEEPGRGTPIALTCGDISGHHVVVSASFFAFQFLLQTYSRCNLQIYRELKARICETLEGHLEWVFRHIEKDLDNSFPFCARHWVNGQRIPLFDVNQRNWDTSLQIIKAKDFASKYRQSGTIPGWLLDEVGNFMKKWIESLRKIDSRDYCMFQRNSDPRWGEGGYYLRDHVLIWKALGATKELEAHRAHVIPRGASWNKRMNDYIKQKQEKELSLGIYTSDHARRRVLKGFTTQNPETHERMFATYRDTQHNNFSLSTEDTLLFYDEDQFFSDDLERSTNPESHDVRDKWVRTLEFHTHQKITNDKDRQEPLRYALAVQMGKGGYQIDSRPVRDSFDEGLKVLLQSCSSSGIFPGSLTRKTQLSRVSIEKGFFSCLALDSYWHTSFELPYILWIYAKERLEKSKYKKQGRMERATVASLLRAERIQTQSRVGLLRAETVFKGQAFIDPRNIFEISDEWLHPCPEFLHHDPGITFNNLQKTNLEAKLDITGSKRLVVDIPKRRLRYDSQTLVNTQPCTGKELFDILRQRRTKKTNILIKKRIIWLSSGEKEAAAICPTMVPESEKPALMGFFRKHTNLDKYFLDDPSASTNSWKTEFQLSFYQLDKPRKFAQSKPEVALAKRIRRASMGFRFNGDFFDCYWTCHTINFGDLIGTKKGYQGAEVGGSTQEVEKLLDDFLSTKVGSSELAFPGSELKKRAWQQRKVLELILFEEIISKITAGTEEILKEIKGVLSSTNPSRSEENETKDLPDKVKETVLFSKIDGHAYFSFSARWEVIQQLLQVLDEDLSDTAKKIENWQGREKNRGTETPRWTKKDEERYSPALRRMQLSNAESVQGLLQLQENIQSLRASLISRRDYIRDDLNLRGAENTRYFTYVTVVFLPLGFATGIFSMSETPAESTLSRMIGTAAITFLLTILVLYFVVNRLEVVNKLRTTVDEALARTKKGLERFLLPFYVVYVLWRALRGSMNDVFNNQGIPRQDTPPPQNSIEVDTGRGDRTVAVPEGNPQGQAAGQRRPASLSGDLENQIGSRHPRG